MEGMATICKALKGTMGSLDSYRKALRTTVAKKQVPLLSNFLATEHFTTTMWCLWSFLNNDIVFQTSS